MTALPHAQKRRRALAGLTAAAAATALVALSAAPANAAPGDEATDSTEGNVVVLSSISLTGLTPSFTLTGLPDAQVSLDGAVTFNVETNNIGGYAVTVTAADDVLLPDDTTANPDSIAIDALSVRETGATGFTALSDTTPTTVHTQSTRSFDGGDTISNDYQVDIPFVNEDTYSVTLDYVATTL